MNCPLLFVALLSASACASAHAAGPVQVERWGVFEASFRGPQSGNPFQEVQFGARFHVQHRTVDVDGFYDGGGVYRVRLMPDMEGEWTFTTRSNRSELNGKKGRFVAVRPGAGNHGPVSVRDTYHFAYADGTPHFSFGTTAYAWTHQGDELEEKTLATLKKAPFNKMRMCVFPKDYDYNKNEPPYYPFPRDAAGNNDYSRFNPEFFGHLEKRVRQLMELGIEADIILFHPYDRWGYQKMDSSTDERYLRYTVSRLAVFRNVWWSMANEWDFMKFKKQSDFDHFFHVVQAADPYQHLRSIHHAKVMYDHSKPWVTHVSLQDDDFKAKALTFRDQYKKPLVYDECRYEGNLSHPWGNISAEEMVHRFWHGMTRGAYVGHGETYLDPKDILWWSKGGELRGQSAPRIAFLRKIVEEGPPEGLTPLPKTRFSQATTNGDYYLIYLDFHQPAEFKFDLDKGKKYTAEIIDPWNMTITPVPGTHEAGKLVKLPGKPYMAVRFRKVP